MEQLYTIGGNEAVAVTVENSKEVLPKTKKIELPHDPVIPLLSI